MRILVLGGTGFIGPHVVRSLIAQGHQVAVMSRGKRRPDLPQAVSLITADYRKLPEFRGEARGIFQGSGPEVVLDMIPMTEQEARNVVDTFRGMVRRIVAASSIEVYRAWGYGFGLENERSDTPLTEDSPLRESRYPYRGGRFPIPTEWDMENYDKILVEAVFQSEPSLPPTIVRLPMVYGPGDYAHRAFLYLKRMDDGREVIPVDELAARWRGPWGYVEDVAEGIALCVTQEAAAGRIYHIAEPDNRSLAEFIRDIGETAGWTGRIVELPRGTLAGPWSSYRVEQDLSTDSSRIRRELGYRESVPRAAAMQRTIEWERAHPPEPFPAAMFDYAAEDRAVEQHQKPRAAGSR